MNLTRNAQKKKHKSQSTEQQLGKDLNLESQTSTFIFKPPLSSSPGFPKPSPSPSYSYSFQTAYSPPIEEKNTKIYFFFKFFFTKTKH